MRIALVCHGFPPHARTGVEVHTEALASALARAGAEVHVFAPLESASLAPLSERRELRDGYHLTWIAVEPGLAQDPLAGPPGIAAPFRAFLAREQIDVVHFQHVAKLGVARLADARAAGLPCVYTAHDYTPLGPNPTLLLPDLREQTDLSAEGYRRWWSARAYLESLARLGDAHGSILLEELDPLERAELSDHLAGGRTTAAASSPDLEAWRDHFRGLDRLFATSRFLAGRLQAALEVEVPVRQAGIELESLRAVEPLDPARPFLRFAYFGALIRPKGVHLLLEAFAPLVGRAELTIHGDSHDDRYVTALAQQAESLGVGMHGGYLREDLPKRLSEVDVVVVPSLWSENAPFVVREARAARRPVIASRTGALAESVRDGSDGLLFSQGAASELRASMQRLIEDRALLERLARAPAPVRAIEEEAEECLATYRELLAARRRVSAARAALPLHLRSFAVKVEQLGRLPTRELCARALQGLRGLQGVLGLAGETDALLPDALVEGARARDVTYAAAPRLAWLEECLREVEHGRGSERERAEWLEGVLAAREQHLATLAAERDEARRAGECLERERDWLREQLECKSAELAWREQSVSGATAALTELERALAELAGEHARLLREHEKVRTEFAEERAEAGRRTAELQAAVAERQRLLELSRRALEEARAEARWRASEMDGARAAAGKLRARCMGGELVRRARAWEAAGGSETDVREEGPCPA